MNENKAHIALPAHIRYTRQLSAKHIEIDINLSHSGAQALTIAQLLNFAPEQTSDFEQLSLEYASVQGKLSLRQKIAQFHQRCNTHQGNTLPEHIITFTGAQEALKAIYQVVISPGDEVVVFTPCYPSLVNMVEQCGGIVKTIELSAKNQWQFDIETLEKTVNSSTKLIVVNAPHNPTGSILSKKEQAKILSLAQQFDCYLLSDDVTQVSVHNENISTKHSFLDYQKTIVVSVMSKSFGLAGVRLGWLVTSDSELIEPLLALKCYGSICTSAVDEYLAEVALSHSEAIIAGQIEQVQINKNLVEQFIAQFPQQFSWHAPKAGFLSVLEIHGVEDINSWLLALAENTGVLLLPAQLFGLNGPYVRLGLGQSNLNLGLEKLKNYCLKS